MALGCAGGGNHLHARAGCYEGFTNKQGIVLVGITDSGDLEMGVVKAHFGYGSGHGKLDADNHLQVVCTTPAGATITVTGTARDGSIDGSITGAYEADFSSRFESPPGRAQFAKHYTGTLSRAGFNTFQAGVGDDGVLEGTVSLAGQSERPLVGQVSPTGFCDLTSTVDGDTITFKGVFFQSVTDEGALACAGSFVRSNGEQGTWLGVNVIVDPPPPSN